MVTKVVMNDHHITPTHYATTSVIADVVHRLRDEDKYIDRKVVLSEKLRRRDSWKAGVRKYCKN